MRITSLLENTTTDERMKVEHGLSLYIETDSHKILFDMGQSELFAENAEKLGIDLRQVDMPDNWLPMTHNSTPATAPAGNSMNI